jgi:hypothetical protein
VPKRIFKLRYRQAGLADVATDYQPEQVDIALIFII